MINRSNAIVITLNTMVVVNCEFQKSRERHQLSHERCVVSDIYSLDIGLIRVGPG